MPSFPNLDEPRLNALIEYLRTEKSNGGRELTAVPAPGEAKAPAGDQTGAHLYQDRCAVCHGEHMEGIAPSFPMLVGLSSRLTREQTVDLIKNGRGAMPGMPEIQGPELEELLRYLGVGDRPKPAAASGPVEYTFTGYRKFLDPEGYPAIQPPWGTLSAINLSTGKYLWKIPFGEYPDLAAKGLRNTGSESYGGPIVTAGGVVFIGATVYDRKFRAFDSQTGDLLWETELPFAGVATPATYMIDGRQYVVIAASGGRDPKGPVGGAYVAFALPK
jgi:cytochrome c553